MRDEFRDDLSGNAKLVDDLDALSVWAKSAGYNEDDPESSVVVVPKSEGSGFWVEFADIIEHLTEDIRDRI